MEVHRDNLYFFNVNKKIFVQNCNQNAVEMVQKCTYTNTWETTDIQLNILAIYQRGPPIFYFIISNLYFVDYFLIRDLDRINVFLPCYNHNEKSVKEISISCLLFA